MDEALVNLKAAANTWLDEAFAELDVEVSDAEDEAAMQQALALMPTPEKLKHLLKTKPAPASWFAEEFQRPTSV